MGSYLFYDVETTGLNPAFDQILTFACIRTDLTLRETARESITIRLRPDIVPSPHAFVTHCLTRDELDKGMSEYQAALRMHKLFNTPGTISFGYNSLGFDDGFLRFLFYRNLLDPYTHQYANGCYRMDMLPVTVVFRLFCSHLLDWPCREDGFTSLKLENLSQKNNFAVSGRAHEAMADVEALVELARVFSREKKVWAYVLAFFDKVKDSRRIEEIEKQLCIGGERFRVCLMVSASFGPKLNYLSPVIHLGDSLAYKNQSLWLRLDREGGVSINGETGLFDGFIVRKRQGDEMLILPVLDRFWEKLSGESRDNYKANLANIQADPARFEATVKYHREFKYPDIPEIDPDAGLYQSGFFSRAEKKEISGFHNKLARGVYGMEFNGSSRVAVLAMRILSRNFYQASKVVNLEYEAHLASLSGESDSSVYGYRGDVKYDRKKGLEDIKTIESGEKELTPLQRQVLSWVKAYILKLA